MLTAEGCKTRRDRLIDQAPEGADVFVIADREHLTYFANYVQDEFVFRSCDAGSVLLIERSGRATLVADNIVGVFADAAHVDERVCPVWYESKRTAPRRESFLVENTLKRLADLPGDAIGVEPSAIPSGIVEGLRAARRNVRFVDIEPTIHRLKRQKDPDELALIRQSIAAGEAGFRAAYAEFKPGMTELDAFLVVQRAATEAAGKPVRIYGDFSTGEGCVTGGGPPTSRVIGPGDLFMLDYSVIVDGYRGDFTNTFAVGGKGTEGQHRLHGACQRAMAAGEAALRAGAKARDVDRAVRGSLEGEGLGDRFPHHSGHGLGLGHPEAPFLVPESDDVLLAGDVITLEPGVYVPGVGGIRIERNYLITDGGYETLTHHRIALDPNA